MALAEMPGTRGSLQQLQHSAYVVRSAGYGQMAAGVSLNKLQQGAPRVLYPSEKSSCILDAACQRWLGKATAYPPCSLLSYALPRPYPPQLQPRLHQLHSTLACSAVCVNRLLPLGCRSCMRLNAGSKFWRSDASMLRGGGRVKGCCGGPTVCTTTPGACARSSTTCQPDAARQ